ncbi:MAG TPA: DUF2268 domain-containing putative Zn-dependent protease [Symbiobacteriaceae bacterium]
MALIPVYQDVLRVLQAVPPGTPVWPAFESEVFLPHRAFFEGLSATYGPEVFGPGGLPAAVEQLAPILRAALEPASSYQMEEYVQKLLDQVTPLLPGIPSNVYLGVLFFLSPAATLSILERPAIALGLERFHPSPPPGPFKYWYHPREAEEMIPHEAAHVARMQVLKLPPTPRKLTLLDMVMLEGTALVFTDLLLGRTTLTTFMPAEQFAWHQANDQYVRAVVASEFHTGGMEAYLRYFSMYSPISGYYVGYSICREYLERYGNHAIRELVGLPSDEILRRVS